MIISFVAERKATEVFEETLDTPGLTELFTTPNIGEKDGLAFIPAKFDPCPSKCRGQGVDCGGGQLHRLDANVREVTMFVVDVDKRPDATFDQLIVSLEDQGLEFWYYETFSHDPTSGLTCGRVVLPMSEPVPATQWRSVWEALVKALAPEAADPKCFNPSRIYNLPRHPEGQSRDAGHSPGKPLEWRQYAAVQNALQASLLGTGVQMAVAPIETSSASPALLAAAEDHVATHRVKNPTTKGTGNHDMVQVGAILLTDWGLTLDEALPIARRHNDQTHNPRSEDELLQCLENASTYSHNPKGHKRLTFELAQRGLKRPKAPPVEGTTETGHDWGILRSRLARAHSPWLKRLLAGKPFSGGHKHGGTRAKGGSKGAWHHCLYAIADCLCGEAWPADMLWLLCEPSWAAETDAPESPRITREELESTLAQAIETAPARLEALNVRASQEQLEHARRLLAADLDPAEWLAAFIGPKGGIDSVYRDSIMALAITHARRWEGLTYDTFRHQYFDQGKEIGLDELIAEMCIWASARKIPYGADCVARALGTIADERKFDSYVQRMEALPEWDQTPRLARVAKDYLGSISTHETYASEVVSRWLIAMVARCYLPGCKVDTALILESEQGGRKTTFFEILAGGMKHYLSTHLGAKEIERQTKGRSIVELNEFSTGEGMSIDQIKAYMSKREDSDRGLYLRAYEDLPRRFVIGGSTNDAGTLRDPTGNRRFWIVPISKIDDEKFKADMPQILAEARAKFLGGYSVVETQEYFAQTDRTRGARWWIDSDLDAELLATQAEVTQEYTEESQLELLIKVEILKLEKEQRPHEITSTWVFNKLVEKQGVNLDRASSKHVRQVARALRQLFGKHHQPHGQMRTYKVSAELLNAPKQTDFSNGIRSTLHLALAQPPEEK